MTGNDDFLARYQAHAKALGEAIAFNKTSIFAALKAASITRVSVTFDGSGDSGQIQEVTAESGDKAIEIPQTTVEMIRTSWGSTEATKSTISLQDAVEDICFDCLSQEHDGWENNDGGQGEFSFDVAEERIELNFEQFYTDSTNHSHTF
jgi:hypothetical protein